MYNSVQMYPGLNSGIAQIWDLLKSIINPFSTMENSITKYNKKNSRLNIKKNYSKSTNTISSYNKITEKNNSSRYNSITEVHSKDGTKWYKGEYDEMDSPISALYYKDSILYPNCKSLVYFDQEIKCAYIDFENYGQEKIKNIEIRQDGIICGLKKQNGKWQPYFIHNGINDFNYSKNELNDLYIKVKNILKKAQSNSELRKNTPIGAIDIETDTIYSDLMCKMR